MADVTSEEWQAQQKTVWGSKDPDVFRRVVERIQRQEGEVLQEVERMVSERVSAYAIVHYITNSILRGADNVIHEPPEGIEMTDGEGRTWDRRSRTWIQKGPEASPASS